MNKVLVICGPTASGKTALAVDCALKLDTEIISADSQLVYKGLNVGTAKPSLEEMRGVVHHMIDVIEPYKSFNVGDYREKALPIVKKLINEGKVPVICGGTGYYINSLLFKMCYGGVGADVAARNKWEKYLRDNGKGALYERLKEVDEQSAEILHENDTKRIIRALEIFELSGKKKSEQRDEMVSEFDYVAVAVNYPRSELYERINQRVDNMFACGLLDEVKGLLAAGIDENFQSMKAIGYKEVLESLKNGVINSTMRDIIKQNTRHYAKRQITFFKKLPNLVWLNPDEATAERVLEIMNGQR